MTMKFYYVLLSYAFMTLIRAQQYIHCTGAAGQKCMDEFNSCLAIASSDHMECVSMCVGECGNDAPCLQACTSPCYDNLVRQSQSCIPVFDACCAESELVPAIHSCAELKAYAELCALSGAIKTFASSRRKVCNPIVMGGLTFVTVGLLADPLTAAIGVELAGTVIILTEACAATNLDAYLKFMNNIVNAVCNANQQQLADAYGTQCHSELKRYERSSRFYLNARQDVSNCPLAVFPKLDAISGIDRLTSVCQVLSNNTEDGVVTLCNDFEQTKLQDLIAPVLKISAIAPQIPADKCSYESEKPQPSGALGKRKKW